MVFEYTMKIGAFWPRFHQKRAQKQAVAIGLSPSASAICLQMHCKCYSHTFTFIFCSLCTFCAPLIVAIFLIFHRKWHLLSERTMCECRLLFVWLHLLISFLLINLSSGHFSALLAIIARPVIAFWSGQ